MQTFTTDGYYKSGNLLMLNEEGYFYYVSRLKKASSTEGGQKIGVEEVEDYLVRHPNVKEAAVVGNA